MALLGGRGGGAGGGRGGACIAAVLVARDTSDILQCGLQLDGGLLLALAMLKHAKAARRAQQWTPPCQWLPSRHVDFRDMGIDHLDGEVLLKYGRNGVSKVKSDLQESDACTIPQLPGDGGSFREEV